ncbi:MAG: hypothetical protein ACPGAL_05065 [Luminiphilus sp.]
MMRIVIVSFYLFSLCYFLSLSPVGAGQWFSFFDGTSIIQCTMISVMACY